jgi:hypothetical protein
LLGVTRKARLGVVCVVWIRRGVERIVTVAATDLADEILPELPSPCRLSVGSARRLVAVVASFSEPTAEVTHATETGLATRTAHSAHRGDLTIEPNSADGGGGRGASRSVGGVGDGKPAGTGSFAQNLAAGAQGGRG